jgi:hypothetical protein
MVTGQGDIQRSRVTSPTAMFTLSGITGGLTVTIWAGYYFGWSMPPTPLWITIILGVVSVVSFMAGVREHYIREGIRIHSEHIAAISATATPAERASAVTSPRELRPPGSALPQTSSARITVDLDPALLIGMANSDDYTSAEVQRLAEPYLGKWMRVRGPVADVGKTKMALANYTSRHAGLYEMVLEFDNEWAERLNLLRKGSDVSVLGQIESVTKLGVHLTRCEIL